MTKLQQLEQIMNKSICRKDEAQKRLETIISDLNGCGELFLPSERDLCKRIGTSRKTLQKALKDLENAGILETGARGRVINPSPKRALKGKILFITAGINWAFLPAWNRLWQALDATARMHGWKPFLALRVKDSPFKKEDLEGYDYIVYTCIGGEWERKFKTFAASRQDSIIGAQEECSEFLSNVVCLDNRAAGRIAATILLDAGCIKPAILYQDNGYLGFTRREEGFLEAWSKRWPRYRVPAWTFRGESTSEYVRAMLDKIDEMNQADIDSVFAVSDGLIELVYDPLARKHKIPDDFSIVTLSGSRECLTHQPPITAVSHASTRVAGAIIDRVEKLRAGRSSQGMALIEPSVHYGQTTKTKA